MHLKMIFYVSMLSNKRNPRCLFCNESKNWMKVEGAEGREVQKETRIKLGWVEVNRNYSRNLTTNTLCSAVCNIVTSLWVWKILGFVLFLIQFFFFLEQSWTQQYRVTALKLSYMSLVFLCVPIPWFSKSLNKLLPSLSLITLLAIKINIA